MFDVNPVPTFAELIINGRRRKGWKQEDLAAASGVSVSSISRWERNLSDRPDAAAVRHVCRALDIDPRIAAISLGFLTVEEVKGPPPTQLDPEIEEALQMLLDPALPAPDRASVISHLKWLHAQRRQQSQAG